MRSIYYSYKEYFMLAKILGKKVIALGCYAVMKSFIGLYWPVGQNKTIASE